MLHENSDSMPALQLGPRQCQITVPGIGILCWSGWQHCSAHLVAAPDQQLWLEVCLLVVRHPWAHLDAGMGPPCP